VEPPEHVYLSPSLLRTFECVAGCTACCLPFTLDFTNDEFNGFAIEKWEEEITEQADGQFKDRILNINGHDIRIQTYEQYKDDSCPYLRTTRVTADGVEAKGCGFWTADNSTQPIECAAAPQLLMTTRGQGNTVLMTRPFGRGWAWKDKPQCDFQPIFDNIKKVPTDEEAEPILKDRIMLLNRYLHWADYLEINTHLPNIIETLQDLPLILQQEGLKMVEVEIR
jgi:hypothetical protein